MAAIVAACVAWGAILSRDYSWLFTDGQGRFLRDVARWYTLVAPLAVGAGAVAAIAVITALRFVRAGKLLEALNCLAAGCLAGAALGASLLLVHKPVPVARQDWREQPRWAGEVFLPWHWQVLASQEREGRPRSELLPNGVGLLAYPGIIPFDAFLLRRLTFVGLTRVQVEQLLGPAIELPRTSPLARGRSLMYIMDSHPNYIPARLYFVLESVGSAEPVVVKESLYVEKREVYRRAA